MEFEQLITFKQWRSWYPTDLNIGHTTHDSGEEEADANDHAIANALRQDWFDVA